MRSYQEHPNRHAIVRCSIFRRFDPGANCNVSLHAAVLSYIKPDPYTGPELGYTTTRVYHYAAAWPPRCAAPGRVRRCTTAAVLGVVRPRRATRLRRAPVLHCSNIIPDCAMTFAIAPKQASVSAPGARRSATGRPGALADLQRLTGARCAVQRARIASRRACVPRYRNPE